MPSSRDRSRSRERQARLDLADLWYQVNLLRGCIHLLQEQINSLREELREDLGQLRADLNQLTRRVAVLDGGSAPSSPHTPQ